MAILEGARAKTLAFTAVSGQSPTPPTGPITKIQNYAANPADELAEFTAGLARVSSSYKGKTGFTINVTTKQLDIWALFRIGQRFNNVILTLEAAIGSGGTAVGGDITVTLSEAVVTEMSGLEHDNENSMPVVGSVTFKLDRHPESSSDPTWSIAAG